MSYSLIGRFVDVNNRRHVIDAELGFLKCLNDRSYSYHFSDINSTSQTKNSDYPDVTSYIDYKFSDYYPCRRPTCAASSRYVARRDAGTTTRRSTLISMWRSTVPTLC